MKKLRYSGLTVSLDYDLKDIAFALSKKTGISQELFSEVEVFRESVDARKFPVTFSLTVDFILPGKLENAAFKKGVVVAPDYGFSPITNVTFPKRPVVVGFGPAGLFAAYYLALAGHRPIVIERGEAVEERTLTVDLFWKEGLLNPESNVQFGEGGAGAFSDGKLTTRVKDPLARQVFKILVEHGAPQRILKDQKPHVGTDVLVNVVVSMRKQIEAWGGSCHFNERFESLVVEDGTIAGLVTNKNTYSTNHVILAIGHSSRETYRQLELQGVALAAKPFAMGLRIEHPQSMINGAQYGPQSDHPRLGAADYQVKAQVGGRGVYSFCMCPGGYVINSSSHATELVVNGMSYHAREGKNANSALLVTVNPEDFSVSGPLGGICLQEAIERAAFNSGVNALSALTGEIATPYSAPIQLVGDFLQKKPSVKLGTVEVTITPDYHYVDFNEILPEFMSCALREALPLLGRQIKGFDRDDAVLTGVETRSSSPVRILRNENWESISHKGLYAIGEGAGYAGGITSSAIDGLASIHKILK